MGIGKTSDMAIYEAEFQGGMLEAIAQNVNAFNAASANGIRLLSEALVGNYNKEAFFDRVADLVRRQDITSVASVTPDNVTQDEIIGVKCHRKIGPVAITRKQLRMAGLNPDETFSFIMGRLAGQDIMKSMLTSGLAALVGAITDLSDLNYDATSESVKTLIVEHLINGMAKRGDKAQEIVAWVMHSKPFYNLMGSQAAVVTDRVAGATIYQGTVGTLGRPCVVVDDSYLYSGSDYFVLGLPEGGLVLTQSEDTDINFEPKVSGYEQLITRYQGEFAFNVNVKGCEYDSTVGVNPTDANLNLTGTWDYNFATVKNGPGVLIKVN